MKWLDRKVLCENDGDGNTETSIKDFLNWEFLPIKDGKFIHSGTTAGVLPSSKAI